MQQLMSPRTSSQKKCSQSHISFFSSATLTVRQRTDSCDSVYSVPLLVGCSGAMEPGTYRDGVIKLGPESLELAITLLATLDVRADDVAELDPDARFSENKVETATIVELRTAAVELLKSLVALRSSSKIELLLNSTIKFQSEVTFEDEKYSEKLSNYARAAMDEANQIKIFPPVEAAKLQDSLLRMVRYNDGDGKLCFSAIDGLIMVSSTRRCLYICSSTADTLVTCRP
eukprot:SAG11_NODE_32_length_22830_cov_17.507941_15_plen_230_part_00